LIILLISIAAFTGSLLMRSEFIDNETGTITTSNVTLTETLTRTINMTYTSSNITSITTNTIISTRIQTSTETSIITSTSVQTLRFITTSTSTVTTFVTTTQIISPTIDLVSIIGGEAASWDKTDLRLLIDNNTANIDAPEINLVEAVGTSLDKWRRSIKIFIENNPQFAYLGRINITVYVQGGNYTLLSDNPDIEIAFYNRLSSSLLGETQLLISNANFIDHAEISISVRDLSARGIINILTHEFGHALGLKHSDEPDDLMYSERERGEVKEIVLCPSTLNLYALSLLYQWIEGGEYFPFPSDSVTLPATEIYEVVACYA
jgi:predicted Zn-dependent protease